MEKIIVDSNYIGIRAHYINPDMEINDLPVNVIFGFLKETIKIIKEYSTNEIIFVFDSKKSYRIRHDKLYKSERKETRDKEAFEKIFFQLGLLQKYILTQIGFNNIYMRDGYEGDDLMAYITTKYTDDDFCMYTADEDLWQMIEGTRVYWYSPLKGSKGFVDERKFREINNDIQPSQWAKVKAIAGKGGELIGIKGIGRVSAIKYMKRELGENTKAFLNVKSNRKLIKHNMRHTVLPYRYGEFPIDISLQKQQKLSLGGFNSVLEEYGFDEVMNVHLINDWREAIERGY